MFKIILTIVTGFILVAVAAIAAASGDVTGAIDPADLILQGRDVINVVATRSAGTAAGVGTIMYFLINLLKMKSDKEGTTLADKIIPKRYRPLTAAILGAVGGLVATIATGGTFPVALTVMLASGSIPVLLNEIMSVTIKNEWKEKVIVKDGVRMTIDKERQDDIDSVDGY